MRCPFCNEDDFDLIGLKAHFVRGHCEVFEQTMDPDEERRQRRLLDPTLRLAHKFADHYERDDSCY